MDLRADRLKLLRKEKGMSQKQLADVLGKLGTSTISGYETGSSNPSLEIIIKMSYFFETSLEYLLGLTDDRKTNLKSIEINNNNLLKALNIDELVLLKDLDYKTITDKNLNIFIEKLSKKK